MGTREERRRVVRARTADAAYLLVGALLTLTDVLPGFSEHGVPFGLAVLMSDVLATVALLWRRRAPVVVAALGLPGVLFGSLGVFPLSVFALAIRRRDGTLLTLGAAGCGLSLLVTQHEPLPLIAAAISNVAGLVLPMAIGAFIGARRDLVASLRARAEQAEAELALRADQARLAERTRIAQEMHDVLAHRISLIGLHAGGLEVQPDAGPEVVERSARLIRETARSALEDLRGVLGVLRTDTSADGADLAPQPQLRDLPRLVESSRAAGIAVTLVDELPDDVTLPEVTGRTVYRVVQEALTNVHKHARQAATTVRLTGKPDDELVVEVVNVRPVVADSLLPGAGVGLVGLRERVELAGGRLEAGPTASGGWQVRARFGWPG